MEARHILVDQALADQFTREALADVVAGATIDHAAVRAWAYSLGTGKPLPLPVIKG